METIVMIIAFTMVSGSITAEAEMRFSGFESMAECEYELAHVTDTLPADISAFAGACVLENGA